MPSMSSVFLMSPPREDWRLVGKANFLSRHGRSTDPAQALEEWASLADVIVDAGGSVVVCPPHPGVSLTGMMYTAEAGCSYRDEQGDPRFVLPRMAAAHRVREADWIGGFLTGLGIACEQSDSIWEAQGDAIRVGPDAIVHTHGVGSQARTSAESYTEVAERLSPRHLALTFQADPWFHGNTFLNVYHPPGQDPALVLICVEALVPGEYERLKAFLPQARFVEISVESSRRYDTNSLQVGACVIAPSTLTVSSEAVLRETGFDVIRIPMPELFEKGGGAPVCLTNRLWGLTADDFSEHALWSRRVSEVT